MKSITKLAEFIEQSNEIFSSMSKDEKKVQIAKDCLVRIKLGQLKPNGGSIIGYEGLSIIRQTNEKSLKTVLNSVLPECKVCAKGGLFMSYVGRVNEFNICDLDSSRANYNSIEDKEHIKLLEIFTARELAYIEMAFEENQCLNYDSYGKPISFTDTESNRVETFSKIYRTSNERLTEICKNIIRNKGTFKLSKHYNKKK